MTKTISVRVPEPLARRLAQAAAESGQRRSQVVVAALERHLGKANDPDYDWTTDLASLPAEVFRRSPTRALRRRI